MFVNLVNKQKTRLVDILASIPIVHAKIQRESFFVKKEAAPVQF